MSQSRQRDEFGSLSKTQFEVLGRISFGDDSCVSRSTARALIKRGLIVQEDQQSGILKIFRYYMPIDVHIRWCEWCSKNYNDDDTISED
jgi:hypothetical protein